MDEQKLVIIVGRSSNEYGEDGEDGDAWILPHDGLDGGGGGGSDGACGLVGWLSDGDEPGVLPGVGAIGLILNGFVEGNGVGVKPMFPENDGWTLGNPGWKDGMDDPTVAENAEDAENGFAGMETCCDDP